MPPKLEITNETHMPNVKQRNIISVLTGRGPTLKVG